MSWLLNSLRFLLLIPFLGTGQAATPNGTWQEAVEAITPAVVTLKINHTRAFDENWNQSTHATGFVVDHERGIILTNRHVIGPGPSTAQAIFQNKEEVELRPLYRDPVHDFGFYQYDPAELEYYRPRSAQLNPAGAQIGVEIRVIGNDAGEQLSILDGTLARLDRAAPNYGYGKYNDFNTYYYQAASGSSGGSSGSPVINREGQVIALNAGSRSSAATSYFLPLSRVVRALTYLQDNRPIPRGTLLATFSAQTYAELEKLGLTNTLQSHFRRQFPDIQNLLVVQHLLPGSPAYDNLLVGDILVSANRQLIPDFETLAEILDTHVAQTINVCVQRAGKDICHDIAVDDLHSHTPQEYLEFDGAVLHELSYQRARHFNRARHGVYLADPGFGFAQAGVPKGATITHFNGSPIRTLDDIQQVLEAAPQGEEVSIRYVTLSANQAEKYTTMPIEHRWYPENRCVPDQAGGVWSCQPLRLATAKKQTTSQRETAPADNGDLRHALVYVRFNAPYPLSGSPTGRRAGTGLIVDHKQGLVLTSRTIVSSSAGNVYLTFGREVEITGQVAYVHPVHNLVLLRYNPADLQGMPTTDVQFAQATFAPGDRHRVIGLDSELKLRTQEATLAEVEPLAFGAASPPRFQTTNTEVLQYINGPTDYAGVVVNEADQIIALWQKFEQHTNNRSRSWHRGMDVRIAQTFIHDVQHAQPWRDLGTQWFPASLAEANKLGLPAAWRKRLSAEDARPLELTRITYATPAAQLLQTGDLLLALDEGTVGGLIDLDLGSQTDQVQLTVLREGDVLQVDVPTVARAYQDLDHIVFWAGALIQPPPLSLARQRQIPIDGAYVSFYRYGSPASRGGLVASLTITEINDQKVANMDEFAQVIATLGDAKTVRVRARHLNQNPQLVTLRLDNRYWPAYQLKRSASGWQRTAIDS